MGGIANYNDPDRESLIRDQLRSEMPSHFDENENIKVSKKDLIFIKEQASLLCGIADNISFSDCDDESAELLDKIENNITNRINSILG